MPASTPSRPCATPYAGSARDPTAPRPPGGGLLPAVLGLCAGCTIGQDDEMARPTRHGDGRAPRRRPHLRRSGSRSATAPSRPDDVVWGDGHALHVGRRSVDLSPASVDQLVVVPGGVYVLSGDELWFTDLQRLRGTGLTAVTDITPSDDGEQLLVTDKRDRTRRWCTRTTSAPASESTRRARRLPLRRLEPADPSAAALQGLPGGLHAGRLGRRRHLLRGGEHGRETDVGGRLPGEHPDVLGPGVDRGP